MFEMLEGRPPFRDPNESRCCMENLMKQWNLLISKHKFPGFQMSLYPLKKIGKIFGRLFQLIMDGRFRFEFVLASVEIPMSFWNEHQVLGSPDRPIFGCRICILKKKLRSTLKKLQASFVNCWLLIFARDWNLQSKSRCKWNQFLKQNGDVKGRNGQWNNVEHGCWMLWWDRGKLVWKIVT